MQRRPIAQALLRDLRFAARMFVASPAVTLVTLITLAIGIGLAAAMLLTRLAAGLLYGVSAHHPLTFVLAPALFIAGALLVSYLPARRATRVNPVEAMR